MKIPPSPSSPPSLLGATAYEGRRGGRAVTQGALAGWLGGLALSKATGEPVATGLTLGADRYDSRGHWDRTPSSRPGTTELPKQVPNRCACAGGTARATERHRRDTTSTARLRVTQR
jgi:hypothetical protein